MEVYNDVDAFNKENKIFKNFYWITKIWMILTAIVIIGALNWGTTALGYNLVELLSNYLNSLRKTNYPIDKIIYIIVALCGVSLAVRRNTWLPFLGNSVLPGTLVPLKTPAKADTKVKIQVYPKAKVAYWAASGKDKKDQDVLEAYGDYTNSGVVIADENGNAELPIIEGAGYKIPSGKKLPRHVHYRVIGNSMIGYIKTVNY
jgi:uncharacterized membrane protein YuzA (DUF378 family)